MKKYTFIILPLIAIFLITSCGKPTDPESLALPTGGYTITTKYLTKNMLLTGMTSLELSPTKKLPKPIRPNIIPMVPISL